MALPHAHNRLNSFRSANMRAMVPALVGLAGVVVGALLTSFNAGRAERAEAHRMARTSARLLRAELWAIAGRARLLAAELKEGSGRDSWLQAARALTTLPESRLWADHREVLAATLSHTDWEAVFQERTSVLIY
jgi:hypothetical protein